MTDTIDNIENWFENFNKFTKNYNRHSFLNEENVNKAFKYFDQDKDNSLDLIEFYRLYNALFKQNGNTGSLTKEQFYELFKHYTGPYKNSMGYTNFETFWKKTARPTLFPRSALIVVDMQNDFITGPLNLKQYEAKEDPLDAIPIINRLVANMKFSLVVYTQDWHPRDHISFYENCCHHELSAETKARKKIDVYDVVKFKNEIEQTLMPTHCIEYTYGAQFHSNLKVVQNKYRSMVIRKGTCPNIDSYSAFYDKNSDGSFNRTSLDYELNKRGITDLYVCGLSTDGCVAATVFDALNLNYRVILVEDACKGANIIRIEACKRTMVEKGTLIVKSDEVNNMINCSERKPQLGYATITPKALTSFFEHAF